MLNNFSSSLSRRLQLLRWAGWYLLLSSFVLAIFGLNYASYMPDFVAYFQPLYVGSALVGHFSSIGALLYFGVLVPLILLLPARRLIKGLLITLAVLALAALVLDYQVYTQYRFHINGVLLNLILEDGGEEIFVFSWQTWAIAGAVSIAIVMLQLTLAWIVEYRIMPARKPHGHWLVALVTLSFLASHGTHIWADAHYDQRITGLTRHIPFFYPTTAKEFLQSRGWANLDENRELAQQALKAGGRSSNDLDYPKAPLSCSPPNDPPMNVLVITVDTWRYDEMDPQTTPFLDHLQQQPQTLRFNRHFSGGNSTQSGIFSLFYGLPGSYWTAMSAGLISPVMLDQFQSAQYQMGIFASAKLTHPAFDRNVFAGIPNLRTESKGDSAWEKDQDITTQWANFLNNRDQNRPFFGFLFYDAPHAYTFPEGVVEPIEPMWERIDHLALNQQFDPQPYLNRHRTSVKYVDHLIKQAVQQLKSHQVYDNTLILITADHGEEFNDNGQNYWGHGSNYTRAQTHVPLLIHWPGKEAATYSHRTSHMDLAPSLLQGVLGCSNPASDYSIGYSLFDQSTRQWLYAGSYYNYAILLEDSILVTYPTGNYEFLDWNNRPLINKTLDPKLSLAVLQALSRFYH